MQELIDSRNAENDTNPCFIEVKITCLHRLFYMEVQYFENGGECVSCRKIGDI